MICHECGSSVTDAEAFCPYCGISLAVTNTTVPDDDSLESTIMITPEEAAKMAKAASVRTAVSNDDAVEEPSEEQPLAVADAESNSIDDVPPPAILSEFSRTESNLPSSSTSEYSAEEIEKSVAPDQYDTEPEEPAATQIEVEAGAIDNIPVAEPSFTETPEGIDLPPAEEISPPEAIASDPIEVSADIISVVSDVSQREPSLPDSEAPAPAILSDSISKPADDLSSYDSYQSPSMFDSVRIIEPGTQGRADDVDTRLHPGSIRLDKPVDTDSDLQEPAEQVISSTAHNIGVGETDGKKSAKLKPLAEGTVLNSRYEIIRKIGGGGMGAVYLASDNNLGGVLRAVKEMVQTHIEEEQQEKAINDFKRESMILSSLDHVSIPTIYDYFYDDKESRFYLVMKYISGGDLSARLRSAPEGRIEEKSVCEWAIQIIDVLDYLHNQPSTIVYRDLKPSNIMIDGNSGRAMLIDFGIARSIGQKEEKGVTAVGTMGYAPPELFSGNVEPRSDIYSLGSTMFHLLTGADPQSNPLLIFDFQKNPRPRQINSQLSDQMERLIMKAVQYNADERFRSAAEMREVLEDHLVKLKAGIVTYGVSEVPASVSLSNQSVFCGFCGQRIVATDMFCAFCGAKQPIAQQGVHVEIYSQAAWTAKLVIEGTSELSAPAFSLQKDDNLLGRRDPMSNIFPEVDLSKYDPQTKISRRHARIWREGNNFLVEDLGSSNGTILSRTANESFRLPPKTPQVLTAGDRIRLGDATLHFIIG